MNVAIFANEVIFPILLFFVFYYFLVIRPETQTLEFDIASANIQSRSYSTDPLNDVYDTILQDDCWQSELYSIGNRQELIDKLIAIAASNGYRLTSQHIENSIQQHTLGSQTNYVCLPIGCWRVS